VAILAGENFLKLLQSKINVSNRDPLMSVQKSHYHFNMTSPAIYRIIVQGHLDVKWSVKLAGMQINRKKLADDREETLLIGRLEDQSALSGVLDVLFSLNLPVLHVECLEKL
jgi:hypothetical protein